MNCILLVDKGKISRITEASFNTEDVVKGLLEELLRTQYQNILPEYVSSGPPIIVREFRTPMGIADFLVVDVDSGRFYLIEVKSNSDYRGAVGQILDYAIGLKSMSVDEILRALNIPVKDNPEIIDKLRDADLTMIVVLPEIGDGFKLVLDYLNEYRIKIYSLELKKYVSADESSKEIIVARLYPDPTHPTTPKKVIEVPKEFDDAMKKLMEIIRKKLSIKDIIYYKTSADLRLKKEGYDTVLARIYPKKRSRALKFDIANREKSTSRINPGWFRLEISIDDIIKENGMKLKQLLEKIEGAYKGLYGS